eukprot:TRINITY_DN6136_c0_g1_i1.p1 TRINITY_DN6136_c0_g1~~TRINITY_DN6136_c0_g1_i1.p1  ORF type:complete len:184 (+),score=46.59 TRINITY_DN6136_c0_g1_i1:198-749(+)
MNNNHTQHKIKRIKFTVSSPNRITKHFSSISDLQKQPSTSTSSSSPIPHSELSCPSSESLPPYSTYESSSSIQATGSSSEFSPLSPLAPSEDFTSLICLPLQENNNDFLWDTCFHDLLPSLPPSCPSPCHYLHSSFSISSSMSVCDNNLREQVLTVRMQDVNSFMDHPHTVFILRSPPLANWG